jgi:hypothetical protein
MKDGKAAARGTKAPASACVEENFMMYGTDEILII